MERLCQTMPPIAAGGGKNVGRTLSRPDRKTVERPGRTLCCQGIAAVRRRTLVVRRMRSTSRASEKQYFAAKQRWSHE